MRSLTSKVDVNLLLRTFTRESLGLSQLWEVYYEYTSIPTSGDLSIISFLHKEFYTQFYVYFLGGILYDLVLNPSFPTQNPKTEKIVREVDSKYEWIQTFDYCHLTFESMYNLNKPLEIFFFGLRLRGPKLVKFSRGRSSHMTFLILGDLISDTYNYLVIRILHPLLKDTVVMSGS